MHNALAYHSGGDDSDNAIGTIFSDEINRVPNVFFTKRFSCRCIRHTLRYEKLVARNIDRYGHLSSAPAVIIQPASDTELIKIPSIMHYYPSESDRSPSCVSFEPL